MILRSGEAASPFLGVHTRLSGRSLAKSLSSSLFISSTKISLTRDLSFGVFKSFQTFKPFKPFKNQWHP
jgi:hypothetical protein